MPFDADLPPQFLPRGPFRGSAARGSGLITPGVLRGPRFRRLFPDIYVPADVDVTLTLRARAAYRRARAAARRIARTRVALVLTTDRPTRRRTRR